MTNNSKLIIGDNDYTGNRIITKLFETDGSAWLSSPYNSFLNICQNEGHIGSDLEFIGKPNTDTENGMNYILGKFAEALIVTWCNKYPECNHFFAHEARLANLMIPRYLDRFVAIGTGLLQTKNHPLYHGHTQMREQQRDIVWVDKRQAKSLLTVPNMNGFIAGLQIKVYSDWRNAFSKIESYQLPIIYFDLNNDWIELDKEINRQKDLSSWNVYSPWRDVKLVKKHPIIEEMKNVLLGFRQLLIKLARKEIDIKYIIDKARFENIAEIGHAITQAANPTTQIVMPESALIECEQIFQMEQQYNCMVMGVPPQHNFNPYQSW